MKSKTTLVASNVRLQEWALQIKDCNNRPREMKMKTWLEQNNITKAKYYYRLRRVREACLDLMEEEDIFANPFVEIPTPTDAPVTEQTIVSNQNVVATVTLSNGLKIEILKDATTEFMKSLFEAGAYVK